ncbi:hypothetical protein L1987_20821 [Smallanthus sonchifolius]|uniref:Uncharacterized protein n=1 Tax=Smallanthus sonchifolius TaxID=185202 RepID=A0ACB9IUD6_9ASTR|nr:hypothetical protein L1987_20821 [Smallanthus sonchifolius]
MTELFENILNLENVEAQQNVFEEENVNVQENVGEDANVEVNVEVKIEEPVIEENLNEKLCKSIENPEFEQTTIVGEVPTPNDSENGDDDEAFVDNTLVDQSSKPVYKTSEGQVLEDHAKGDFIDDLISISSPVHPSDETTQTPPTESSTTKIDRTGSSSRG